MIDANKETETTYNSSSVNVCLLKNVNVHVHGTALITASLNSETPAVMNTGYIQY